jgi:hypothetical protein
MGGGVSTEGVLGYCMLTEIPSCQIIVCVSRGGGGCIDAANEGHEWAVSVQQAAHSVICLQEKHKEWGAFALTSLAQLCRAVRAAARLTKVQSVVQYCVTDSLDPIQTKTTHMYTQALQVAAHHVWTARLVCLLRHTCGTCIHRLQP